MKTQIITIGIISAIVLAPTAAEASSRYNGSSPKQIEAFAAYKALHSTRYQSTTASVKGKKVVVTKAPFIRSYTTKPSVRQLRAQVRANRQSK